MKALVVDDSTTIRRIVVKALGEIGVKECVEAGDGDDAVTLSQGTTFDIILMDWNMPKMSGLDAVKAIRATGNKTPIIMVTTEAEKTRVIEAIRAGVNDYLIKPFTPQQLAEKVKTTVPVAAA